MGRVFASMAEVSSDFLPIEPGIHRYEIQSCEEVKSDGEPQRVQYRIKSKIVEVIEGKAEDEGRTLTDIIHIHKKNGELNEIGLAQLKRYFEVVVGEEQANDPEADTDWLVGQQFKGQTGIRSYKVKDNLTGEEEERSSNELQKLAPV